MEREGVSTLSICSYLRALSFLLDHLLLFESVLCDVGLKIFWKCLCNDSCFYKNAYKVFGFEKSLKKCLFMEDFFESDFEKCLCNDSCLYKNAYKELCLLKMFQLKVLVWKCFFLVVSKQATTSVLPT